MDILKLKLSQLIRAKIYGNNGPIGKVVDFYFDETSWEIKFVAMELGKGIFRRKVFLPVNAFINAEESETELNIVYTKKEIKHCFTVFKYRRKANNIFVGAEIDSCSQISIPSELYLVNSGNFMNCKVKTDKGLYGYLKDFNVDKNTWKISHLLVEKEFGLKSYISTDLVRFVNVNKRTILIDKSHTELPTFKTFHDIRMDSMFRTLN